MNHPSKILVCAFMLFGMIVANASPVILNATDRGWFRDDGQHIPDNKNTATGNGGGAIFRSFFVFDLSEVHTEITTAYLRLELYRIYLSGFGNIPDDLSFAFTLYGVSTNSTQLGLPYDHGSVAGTLIYEDLGTGTVYGQHIAHSSEVGTVLSLNLSPEAVLELNRRSDNTVVIGVALDDTDFGIRAILFSEVDGGPYTHQLILTTDSAVSEPVSLILMLIALIAASFAYWFGNDRQKILVLIRSFYSHIKL